MAASAGRDSPARATAWAVGSDNKSRALALRWSSGKWVRVPSIVTALAGYSALFAVAAVRSAAWAVGSYDALNHQGKTLIERWTGRRWKQVPSPSP